MSAGSVAYDALCAIGLQLKAEAVSADGRIVLSVHVAHCALGCVRTSGQPIWGDSAYDRAPTHQKPELPTASDLAAMLTNGDTVDAIAERYDRSTSTVYSRLRVAGYRSDGTLPELNADTEASALTPFVYDPWRDDALCAQTDPDAFFPEKGGSTREAKATCDRCPVAAECLDYAMANQERFGIWGGLSERERRRLERQLADTNDFPTSHATKESA